MNTPNKNKKTKVNDEKVNFNTAPYILNYSFNKMPEESHDRKKTNLNNLIFLDTIIRDLKEVRGNTLNLKEGVKISILIGYFERIRAILLELYLN